MPRSSLLFILLFPLAAQAGERRQVINPCPRQILRTESLYRWTFRDDAQGWKALHDCTLAAGGGALRIQCSGNDPYLAGPPVHIEGPCAVRLRVKCSAAGDGQIFWTTAQRPDADEARSQHFKLVHDGRWHDYSVPLDTAETIARLRFDPGEAPGLVEIARIEALREIPHPLEIEAVRCEGRRVDLTIKNHSGSPVTFTVGGRKHVVGSQATQDVSVTGPGAAPFSAWKAVVQPDGLPPIERTVFLADLQAAGDWVPLKSGSLTLRLARDGSGARIENAGKTVGLIAPLVWRNGVVPKLKLAKEDDALRFEGEGVSVTVSLRGKEIAIAVRSDGPCEGPVVRAIGLACRCSGAATITPTP